MPRSGVQRWWHRSVMTGDELYNGLTAVQTEPPLLAVPSLAIPSLLRILRLLHYYSYNHHYRYHLLTQPLLQMLLPPYLQLLRAPPTTAITAIMSTSATGCFHAAAAPRGRERTGGIHSRCRSLGCCIAPLQQRAAASQTRFRDATSRSSACCIRRNGVQPRVLQPHFHGSAAGRAEHGW